MDNTFIMFLYLLKLSYFLVFKGFLQLYNLPSAYFFHLLLYVVKVQMSVCIQRNSYI